ncbi:Reticulon protein B22 [Spatholobus suberectus]|nr:Reticulon protein B22 [Spatholobus suberectus]
MDGRSGSGIRSRCGRSGGEAGKALIALVIGTLVYYHCAYRNSTLLSLFSDVFIVLLCSLAILGLLFRQMNIQVPVDPLEWQISQDTANAMVAWLANTIGAAESVLRVAATGHDKRLFLKVTSTIPFSITQKITNSCFLPGHCLPLCIVCSWKIGFGGYRCLCRYLLSPLFHSSISLSNPFNSQSIVIDQI